MNIKLNVKLLTCAALFILPATLKAQYYHRLAASDFTGTPPPETYAAAFTSCNVTYTYNVVKRNNDYNVDFNVQLVFDRDKSYIRFKALKDQDELLRVLRHEQGHYNIAFLLKCDLYSTFKHYHYTANYQREITTLFNQVNARYQKINDDYERQTQHSQNDAKQDEWNAWFSRALDNVPVGAAMAER